MDDGTGALGIVQVILGALGLSGAGGGVVSVWMHWHNRRAQVSADERKAKADRLSALDEENRLLRAALRMRDDYINELRHRIATGQPPPPPPWPEGFTHF